MISKDIKAYRLSRYELNYIDRLYKFYKTKITITDSYRLPEIYEGNFLEFEKYNVEYLSEETPTELINENHDIDDIKYNNLKKYANPDFLGFYRYRRGEEGKIFLYIDRIQECSNRLSLNLNLDYEKTYLIVKFIVLFHELGHWFSHWVCREKINFNSDIFHTLSKVSIESIAQLNVLWALHGHKNDLAKDIREVFFYIVDRQPYEYKQFLLLDKKNASLRNEKSFTSRTTTLNRYLSLIDYSSDHLIIDDFAFLLFGKKYN